MSKHTLNGRRRKVIKTSGFRARMATKTGRKIEDVKGAGI